MIGSVSVLLGGSSFGCLVVLSESGVFGCLVVLRRVGRLCVLGCNVEVTGLAVGLVCWVLLVGLWGVCGLVCLFVFGMGCSGPRGWVFAYSLVLLESCFRRLLNTLARVVSEHY